MNKEHKEVKELTDRELEDVIGYKLDKDKAFRERFEKINKELQGKLQTAERYGDQLRNTLRKHNLTHLANKKPGMIEKRMQNATDRLWGCLYDITDPDGMFADAGTESPYCNKNSKNRGANSPAPEGSPAK